MKVDGSVAIISIKNLLIILHEMYLYFPDMPRTYIYIYIYIYMQRKTTRSHLSETVNKILVLPSSGSSSKYVLILCPFADNACLKYK